MKNNSQKKYNNKGYMTLITTLVVTAVGLSIALSIIMLGLGSSRSAFTLEQSVEALTLAHTCAEEALEVVRNNTAYTGTNNLSLGNGTCTYTVENIGSGGTGGNVLSLDLDEITGTTFADSSGNGRDFVCSAGECPTLGVSGQFGTALDFDGINDQLVDADGEGYLNGLTAFTISIWVESDQTNTDRGFINGVTPDGDDDPLSFRYDASGANGGCTNCLKSGIGMGTVLQIETSSSIQTTNWQHLVLTWSSGNQLAVYIDGVIDTPSSNSSGATGALVGLDQIIIGRSAKDTATSWDGRIDNIDVWNSVLSPAQITELYTNGSLGGSTANKQVEVTSSVGNVVRKVRVRTSQVNPQILIDSWQEVPAL